MVAKVVWLNDALDELDSVLEYIERDSPSYATIVGQAIVDAVNDLARFPLMGPYVPERGERDLRQRVVYHYRVIYRVTGDRVEILSILHTARSFPDDIAARGGA